MENIGQIVQEALTTQNKENALVTNYTQEEKRNFLSMYNPDLQYKAAQDKYRTMFGKGFTLNQVSIILGAATTKAFMVIQINDLLKRIRKPQNSEDVDDLCKRIISVYGHLKLIEVMLVMWNFKNGKYGRFYGDYDPLIVMEAFDAYMREKNACYLDYQQMQRERAEEERRKSGILVGIRARPGFDNDIRAAISGDTKCRAKYPNWEALSRQFNIA